MGRRASLKKERRAARTRSRFVTWGELQKIYARLPTIECTGKCSRACGMIPVHRAELEEIKRVLGKRFPSKHCRPSPLVEDGVVLSTPEFRCPLLDDNERCTIYEVRPIVCRLYGVAKGMTCPHGCQPSRLLEDREAHELIKLVKELSHGIASR